MKQIDPEILQEFRRIGQILLPFQDLPQPYHLFVGFIQLLPPFLIKPMGGYAIFSRTVHLVGPDLYLHHFSPRSYHRSVKRLIHVGFRQANVVVNAIGHRHPKGMNDAQRMITLGYRIHYDPNGKQIIDLFKGFLPLFDFAINGIKMLGSARDLCLYVDHPQFLIQRKGNLLNIGLSVLSPFVDLQNQFIVSFRIYVFQRQIFQLPFHSCHAEAMSQRGINLAGFLSNSFLLLSIQGIQGPHIV